MTESIRVLVAEDNPADADLLQETINEGKLQLKLTTVKDGVEVIEYLRGEGKFAGAPRPDLILLDLNLPRMNGRQVLAKVKSDANLRGIPIVVLTSSSAEQDIAQSYNLGANCYVMKPVDLKAFQAIVRQVEDFWFTIVKLPPKVAPKRETKVA